MDAARGRHVPVAGTAARLRCQRTTHSRERARRALRAGTLFLRTGTAAEHATPHQCLLNRPRRPPSHPRRNDRNECHRCGHSPGQPLAAIIPRSEDRLGRRRARENILDQDTRFADVRQSALQVLFQAAAQKIANRGRRLRRQRIKRRLLFTTAARISVMSSP